MNPSLPLPSGMVLPPIVDPDQPGPPYLRGERVDVDGASITYLGTHRVAAGLVAEFEVSGDLPSPTGDLFFLPSGPAVELEPSGDRLVSRPFVLSSPDPTTLFAWQIGTQTFVWELAAVGE